MDNKPIITFTRQDLLFEAREICNQLKRHRVARFGPGKSSGLWDRLVRLIPEPDMQLRVAMETSLLCDIAEGVALEENTNANTATQFLIEYLIASYL